MTKVLWAQRIVHARAAPAKSKMIPMNRFADAEPGTAKTCAVRANIAWSN